ncbi:MAG: phosphatidylglycerophosphatase A [Candidatus Acidiferrales bacterium]
MIKPTDAPQEAASVAPARPPAAARKPATAGKPRFALFIATACGLGYFPKAPGTFGALAGLLLGLLPFFPFWVRVAVALPPRMLWDILLGVNVGWTVGHSPNGRIDGFLISQCALALATAAIGVWGASRAAKFWQQEDPQRVVIDEVSGQHLTLLLGCAVPIWWKPTPMWSSPPIGLITTHSALNWKYLLLGFILFRVFDIWKPFPARQAESLPGGWGIMADDWIAGIYAAIGLWIARAAGL